MKEEKVVVKFADNTGELVSCPGELLNPKPAAHSVGIFLTELKDLLNAGHAQQMTVIDVDLTCSMNTFFGVPWEDRGGIPVRRGLYVYNLDPEKDRSLCLLGEKFDVEPYDDTLYFFGI
jgi:hypothetical protein